MGTMWQSIRPAGWPFVLSFCVIGAWLLGLSCTPSYAVAPVANAGADRCEGIPSGFATWGVTLDGSGSYDPDAGGSITAYKWTGVSPQPNPSPNNIMAPTVTLGQGNHSFRLMVTDNTGLKSTRDKVTITMAPTTIVPDAGGASGEEGYPVDLDVVVTDCSSSTQMLARGHGRATGLIHFLRRDFDPDDGGGFEQSGRVEPEVRVPIVNGVATARYKFGPRRVQRVRARFDNATSGQEAPFILTQGAPGTIAVEADGYLLVTDLRRQRVWRINPVDGTSTVLSDATSPGAAMSAPHAISVATDGAIVITDHGNKRAQIPAQLLRIAPRSGERTILSACAQRGSGPCFGSPVGIVAQGGGFFVLDRAARDGAGMVSPAVLYVDAQTGDRRVVSANHFFDGRFFNNVNNRLLFGFPQSLTISPAGLLAVVDGAMPDQEVAGKYEPGIVYVDPSTGRRILGPNNTATTLFPFGSPLGIATTGGTLIVVDNDVPHRTPNGDGFLSPTILRVNPITGVRVPLVSNFDRDQDVLLKFPYGVAIDSTGMIVVVDVGHQPAAEPRVLRIDPADGHVTVLSGSEDVRGRGKALQKPIDVAADRQGMLWVLDGQPRAFRVVQVSPGTGNRLVISTVLNSGDYVLGAPVGIAAARGAVWVLDKNVVHRRLGSRGPAVLEVNPRTGELIPVFPATPGLPLRSDMLGSPVDLAAQSDGFLWVLDTATRTANGLDIGPAVWKVDPLRKAGKVVSSSLNGRLAFGQPVGITVQDNGRDIWVADRQAMNSAGNLAPVIWHIDPHDGTRTEVILQNLHQPLQELRDIAVDPVTGHLYTLDLRVGDLSVFYTPGVRGIDLTQAQRFPVSGNQFFDEGFYAHPVGIALTAQEYRVRGLPVQLFVVDAFLDTVLGVAVHDCGDRLPKMPCGRRVLISK